MSEYKGTLPLKAIRLFCLECCGGSSNEVKLCSAQKCALYPFRFGKNPFRPKRELTNEQRAAIAERLKAARNVSKAYREKGKETDLNG